MYDTEYMIQDKENTPLNPPLPRGELKGGIVNHESCIVNHSGFTLIELVISVTILLIVSLGFFGWASTIIRTNVSIERNNTAYDIAKDVADRLQRITTGTNDLIEHKTGSTEKCIGYDSDGNLKTCSGCSGTLGASPAVDTGTGKTEYTDPVKVGTTPYLYDGNACEGKTWVDAGCGSGVTITSTANPKIDHPNAKGAEPGTTDTYDSINPIRSYKNTTYYAVWSIAYTPCVKDENRRKIFVTVYWIDPEPAGATVTIDAANIIKSVSIAVDKTIGVE
ncbi:MAG: prepilin-type N-terminal cleavage/methylation domain-containing protein [Nitrospirae bacterium]|nr:prepilin-type N-terminal cleavage/methylation domain-containing protein [Nitrospirota bacterium]